MKMSCMAALLVLTAAVATTAIAEDGEKVKTEKSTKEKKVCRSERVTGSLTRVKRICMTQAKWDELAANTKRGIDDLNRTASGANGCADAVGGC